MYFEKIILLQDCIAEGGIVIKRNYIPWKPRENYSFPYLGLRQKGKIDPQSLFKCHSLTW